MNIALIEISRSHDECLYSQILFLKSQNHFVTLICSENLKKQVEDFNEVDEKYFINITKKGFFKSLDNILKIRNVILKNNVDKVIFNTASGSLIKKLMLLPFPSKIEFLGTIHNVEKLQNSFGQKIISRKVKKYFVLSEYLFEEVKNIKKLKFDFFYPIFFKETKFIELNKPSGEIWIVIPGKVEFKRRDYLSLFEQIENKGINNNIKIILLGKCLHQEGDGRYVKETVKKLNIENNFIIWDNFLDNQIFHSYLKAADFILPLIDQNHICFEMYTKKQITGAYNLAFAYKIPLLIEKSLSGISDFSENSIFYKKNDLINVVNSIDLTKIDKKFYNNPKWEFEFQKKKYLELLNL